MTMYQSTGIVRCVSSQAKPGYFWIYLSCCEDLGRYYRYAARYLNYRLIRLMKPAWGVHITVVRQEKCPRLFRSIKARWEGLELGFSYKNLRSNGKHAWLDVESDELRYLRTSLLLPEDPPEFGLHCTVGVVPGDPK